MDSEQWIVGPSCGKRTVLELIVSRSLCVFLHVIFLNFCADKVDGG